MSANVDLIVTTYNRVDALECVLVSIMQQFVLPKQVIVADDGSDIRTKNLIDRYKIIFPVKLIHSWHEDKGFRAAECRNLALSKVKAEYVIIIDGDMVLNKNFIGDHLNYAEAGYFLQGGRVMMTKEKSSKILNNPHSKLNVRIFDPGLESRLEKRLTAFRSTFLAKFFVKLLRNNNKVRSCNMSFYYKDIVNVNGFNNEFIGWGREDSEFVERLLNSGIKGKIIKFVALAYHLYHPEEPKESLPQNDRLLNHTISNNLKYCVDGLSKFTK